MFAVSVDDIELVDCSVPTGGQCLIEEYSCLNGNCVAMDALCNFVDDCKDTTDELDCPTYRYYKKSQKNH